MEDNNLETQSILINKSPKKVSFNTDKNEYQSDPDKTNTPSIKEICLVLLVLCIFAFLCFLVKSLEQL